MWNCQTSGMLYVRRRTTREQRVAEVEITREENAVCMGVKHKRVYRIYICKL